MTANFRVNPPAGGEVAVKMLRSRSPAAGYTDRYKDMMIFQNLQRRSLQMPTEWKGTRPQDPHSGPRRLFLMQCAGHGKRLQVLRKQGSGLPWGRREPRFQVGLSMSSDMHSSWSSCSSYTGRGPRIAGLARKGLAEVPVIDRPLSNLALQPSPGAVGVLAQVVA